VCLPTSSTATARMQWPTTDQGGGVLSPRLGAPTTRAGSPCSERNLHSAPR
jgi:hypothetical protein